jgi:hypothetical protein
MPANDSARILAELDKAGESLKQLGEQSIVLGYFAAGPLFVRESFTARIELPGTPGVHGTGATPSEAIGKAWAQREEDARRLDLEDQVRAEVERRMQRKEAA